MKTKNQLQINFVRNFCEKDPKSRFEYEWFFKDLEDHEESMLFAGFFFLSMNLIFLFGWFLFQGDSFDIYILSDLRSMGYFVLFISVFLISILPFPLFRPFVRHESIIAFFVYNVLLFVFFLYLFVSFYESDAVVFIDWYFLEIKRATFTFEKFSVLFDREIEQLNLNPLLKEKMISLKLKIFEGVENEEEFLQRFYTQLRKLKFSSDD